MRMNPPSRPSARLISLATAVPEHVLPQAVVTERAAELFLGTQGGFERLAPVFRNAEIETRNTCTPIEWFLEPHSFSDRNDLFLENAVSLLAKAATEALAEAGLKAGDIDTLITVCSTGIATPALDARLMEVMDFRRDVQRLPIFGLGCAGGVLGLTRAASLARADPDSRVLLLVVELCALTFRHADKSKSNLVASALFADGAAAAVVSAREEYEGKPALGPGGEHCWPDSLDVMGWDVAEDGLKVIFSRDIPTLVRNDFGPVIDAFLARHHLSREDLTAYVCHPGGAKVLDALEETLSLPSRSLVHARDTLRAHGNMSAVTVLFVLKATMEAGEHGRMLMTTLGPGFTAGLQIIDIVEPAA
jgi:alkylresorcinol/alkylpyrone synthase